jgi:hypothetical protein
LELKEPIHEAVRIWLAIWSSWTPLGVVNDVLDDRVHDWFAFGLHGTAEQ